MRASRFFAICAMFGLFMPLFFYVVWYFLDKSDNFAIQTIVNKVMLLIWPASLMTLPISPDPNFERKLFVIALFMNVIYYLFIGALIWLGLKRNMFFIILAIIFVGSIWQKLLTL